MEAGSTSAEAGRPTLGTPTSGTSNTVGTLAAGIAGSSSRFDTGPTMCSWTPAWQTRHRRRFFGASGPTTIGPCGGVGYRRTKTRVQIRLAIVCVSLLLTIAARPLSAASQETAGRRVFPDQLVLSEPFVEDELALPSVLHIRTPFGGEQRRASATAIDGEIKKRITRDFEASISGGLSVLDQND